MLRSWSDGDREVADELFRRIYPRLRRMAGAMVVRGEERGGLHGTEVLHEAFLRLLAQRTTDWRGREHFFSVAALTMRRVLVDQARRRRSGKRGGVQSRVPIDERLAVGQRRQADPIALDQVLRRLARFDPRKVRVVELRYFLGLTLDETAEILGCSPATVSREQQVAKAWLRRELEGSARR